MKCLKCGKEYNIELCGHISPFAPILYFCEDCIDSIENGVNIFLNIE